ncbi:hypothetical protein BC332_30612 [Capsicum chinense]|nr:hypothetical protein BC332_30612 [Capsicum chinense]
MYKALHEGPWFVTGKFLSVRHWEPNFIPKEATQTHVAIWTRLPQLPIEFYDNCILERIGKHLGTLLKIDTCTSAVLRGVYARIFIQVPLDEPIKKLVIIEAHKQKVVYEGEGVLCTACGRIGHTHISFPNHTIKLSIHSQEPSKSLPSTSKEVDSAEEWHTVKFSKKKQIHRGKKNTKEER